MSDAILERQAKALEGILALLQKAPVFGLPTGAATPPKADKAAAGAAAPKGDANAVANDTTMTPAQKKAAADKAIADRKAAKEAADNAAAAKGGAKGKKTIEQVREMIRKVAADVDKQTAKDILKDDGGGVEKVLDLKPEHYDAVFEACEVVLKGEGKPAAAAEEEDDFA
jgi:hypothetical protein